MWFMDEVWPHLIASDKTTHQHQLYSDGTSLVTPTTTHVSFHPFHTHWWLPCKLQPARIHTQTVMEQPSGVIEILVSCSRTLNIQTQLMIG